MWYNLAYPLHKTPANAINIPGVRVTYWEATTSDYTTFPAVSGIYAIYCQANDHIYIGQSKNVRNRIKEHSRQLINGKHQNPFLLNSWKRYGSEPFLIAIIEIVLQPTIDNLNAAENKWLHIMRDNRIPLFNMLPVGGSRLGSTASLETRQKMSKARKGKKQNPDWIAKRTQGLIGKKPSDQSREANRTKHLGIKRSVQSRSKQSATLTGTKNEKRRKHYTFVSPTGETIQVHGLQEFCRKYNLNIARMWLLSVGKAKSHKGWKRP